MHELSLAEAVLRLIDDAAEREGFTRVVGLRLSVGRLAAVDVDALRFALEHVAAGTRLAGARIEIDEPPGVAHCPGCGHTVHIDARTDPCPQCGHVPLYPCGGTDLRVVDIEVC